MKRSVSPLVICAALAFLAALGCGQLGQKKTASVEAEANAEKDRKEKAERCLQEKQALTKLDARVDDFARLPAKTQLITLPYLKGKLFIVETRDKQNYVYDFSGTGCRMSKDCSGDAGCKGIDKFSEVRARSIEEVGTVALIECRKIKKGTFVQTGSSTGEKIPGYDLSCNVTLVDRSIPAVIYKKQFDSELLMVEDSTSVSLSGPKELVARTPTSEMDEFLLKLQRR
jgi:hypothetical protein